MRVGVLLALVSSVQIYQQSVLSAASTHFEPLEFAVANSAFSLGKFVSTFYLVFKPCSSASALHTDAVLLIIGGIIGLIPTSTFLTIGRFLIGCGAGLGFVASTTRLCEIVPYAERPKNFFVLGIAFAFASFLVNALQFADFNYQLIISFFSILTVLCGLVYIMNEQNIKSVERSSESLASESYLRFSSFPSLLMYGLMIANVAIGVPITLAYSTPIFRSFGNTLATSTSFSMTFPLAQMGLMVLLYNISSDRKMLILGGFCLSIGVQAVLLLTNVYPFLPFGFHKSSQSLIFWILCVIISVPCNTSLCLISEQFNNSPNQMNQISRGRSVMWILTALSTATFPYMLGTNGFFITFFPYFFISSIVLAFIARIFPPLTTVL
ncbi:unnamed protein product [Auanema sp. JU1783]|nr:unnamed protein product [Auanema sp. JU1783]